MQILSGRTGQPPKEHTFAATSEDFVLHFQEDLADICTAHKTLLGIDVVYNRFVPAPGKGKFIMCRFESVVAEPLSRSADYTYQLLIGRAGSQTAMKAAPAAFTVEYTLERLIRMLQANGNFNGTAGIARLAGMQAAVDSDNSPFVKGNLLELATLIVTYTRNEPELYPSNR